MSGMTTTIPLPSSVTVARGLAQLMGRSRVQGPDGNEKMLWEAFEKPLTWRMSSESSLVLRHKGVQVKELCRYHDMSSQLLHCVFSASEDIRKFAQGYAILPREAFTLDLDVTYFLSPFTRDKEDEDWEVVGEDRYWHTADPDFMEAINGIEHLKPGVAYDLYVSHNLEQKVLKSRITVSRQSVWSSGSATSLEDFASLKDWVERERAQIGLIAEAPAESGNHAMERLRDVIKP